MSFDIIETDPSQSCNTIRRGTMASISYKRNKRAKYIAHPLLVIGIPKVLSQGSDWSGSWALALGKDDDQGKARIVKSAQGIKAKTHSQGGVIFRFGYVSYLGSSTAAKEYITARRVDGGIEIDLPPWFKPDEPLSNVERTLASKANSERRKNT